MEFYYPQSIAEAKALLRKPSSIPVGGGTSFKKINVNNLVDLTTLPLSYIKESENHFEIGATTTVAELLESSTLRKEMDFLTEACNCVADAQLRNVITVGGNIACRFNWAILPTVFLVLDARIVVVGRNDREISIQEYLGSKPKAGQFIKEIRLNKLPEKLKGAFYKFSKTQTGYPTISVVACAEVSKQKLSNMKIAISGFTIPPMLLKVENQVNRNPDDITLDDALRDLSKIETPRDYEYSSGYIRQLACNIIKRVIHCLAREGE